jgi:hypothetical protein
MLLTKLQGLLINSTFLPLDKQAGRREVFCLLVRFYAKLHSMWDKSEEYGQTGVLLLCYKISIIFADQLTIFHIFRKVHIMLASKYFNRLLPCLRTMINRKRTNIYLDTQSFYFAMNFQYFNDSQTF